MTGTEVELGLEGILRVDLISKYYLKRGGGKVDGEVT